MTHCREFARLVEANAVAQLPESEFEVDPGLRDMVEAQIKQEEEAVRQVCLVLPVHSCSNPVQQIACAFDSSCSVHIRLVSELPSHANFYSCLTFAPFGLQELAWESEKKRLAVAKLRKHFLGDLEVEHIVLHAFRLCIMSAAPQCCSFTCLLCVYTTSHSQT